MKRHAASERVWALVNDARYQEADALLTKYRRKFGHRSFTYWLRLHVKNGLYFS